MKNLTTADLLVIYLSFFIIDSPRYLLSKIIMLLHDIYIDIFHDPNNGLNTQAHNKKNFVSILCPGKNEVTTMPKTIQSLLKQDYPYFEIIAIDDGSKDNTWDAIKKFKSNPKVKLFRRHIAGGKSSAANMGLSLATLGDIIVIVDSDSEYKSNAITEIVKPFQNADVGGVSGNLRVANWHENLICGFQAADYIHSISLGRRFTSWIGTLTVCSGAFGAFRTSAVKKVGGWDVGPGEDGDLTLKIRKIGYKIVFAPEAFCYTKAPNTWVGFWKQRRRWNRGLVRYKMRKHFDMAIPGSKSFSFTNMLAIADVLFFRIILCYSFFIYFIYSLIFIPSRVPIIFTLTWCIYTISSLTIIMIQLYYSTNQVEDIRIMSYSIIMYPYRLLQRIIRLFSITEEFFFRKSYKDPYVPKRVGEKTIHW